MGFPEDWQYKIKVTLASAIIDAALTDFTSLLVRSGATGIPDHVFANANADGSDIRVSLNADGSGLLTADVIHWVATAGSQAALVRIGTMSRSASADDTVYLWYGNANATAQTGSGAYDDDWRCYYPGGPVGASGAVADRTANGNNLSGGLGVGDVADGPVVAGVESLVFDGSTVETAAGVGAQTAAATLLAYVKTNTSADNAVFFAASRGGSDGNMWCGFAGDLAAFKYGGKAATEPAPADYLDNAWHHYAGENISATSRRVLMDGSELATNSEDDGTNDRTDIFVGAYHEGVVVPFTGSLAEIQYHKVARGDAWIDAEYAQTSDAGNAVSFASAALERVQHNDQLGALDALSGSANEAYGSYVDADGVTQYRNQAYGDSHNDAYGSLAQNEAVGSHFEEVV